MSSESVGRFRGFGLGARRLVDLLDGRGDLRRGGLHFFGIRGELLRGGGQFFGGFLGVGGGLQGLRHFGQRPGGVAHLGVRLGLLLRRFLGLLAGRGGFFGGRGDLLGALQVHLGAGQRFLAFFWISTQFT